VERLAIRVNIGETAVFCRFMISASYESRHFSWCTCRARKHRHVDH